MNCDLSEYIRHTRKDEIKHIESCCDIFLKGKYKCKKHKRRVMGMLARPFKIQMEKISDSDVSIKETWEILSKPQVWHGIFTVLAGTVLPALI